MRRRDGHRGMPVWLTLLLALVVGFFGGYLALRFQGGEALRGGQALPSYHAAGGDSVALGPRAAMRGGLPYFVTAAARAKPGVVHVRTRGVMEQASPYRGSVIEFFFGPQPDVKVPVQVSGSGAIVDREGHIITNNHVIANARQIEVSLPDGRHYPARVVSRDPATDLALLKVNTSDVLPYLEFGPSDSLRVGEWVLAIGNPFNLETTVTAGIVSARPRNIDLQSGRVSMESFIQIDAAVNPGNSGGPLVDLDGRLVGINTAIASPTGAFAGYAFAIPETIVEKFLAKSLRRGDGAVGGEVQRVYLGVHLTTLNDQMAAQLTGGDTRGALVIDVIADSPAAQAGLMEGDVIQALNGVRTNTVSQLQSAVSKLQGGDRAKLTVIRGGRTIEVEVAF